MLCSTTIAATKTAERCGGCTTGGMTASPAASSARGAMGRGRRRTGRLPHVLRSGDCAPGRMAHDSSGKHLSGCGLKHAARAFALASCPVVDVELPDHCGRGRAGCAAGHCKLAARRPQSPSTAHDLVCVSLLAFLHRQLRGTEIYTRQFSTLNSRLRPFHTTSPATLTGSGS